MNQRKKITFSDVSGAIHVMGISAYSGATYIWGATIQVLSRHVGITTNMYALIYVDLEAFIDCCSMYGCLYLDRCLQDGFCCSKFFQIMCKGCTTMTDVANAYN